MIRYSRILFVFIVLSFITDAVYAQGAKGKAPQYVIAGALKNGGGQTIYLELLNMQKVTTIDSAKTDPNGNFRLSSTAEKGFYRLRVDNQHFWLMLLENKTYKADLDYSNPQAFSINGAPLNDEFQAGSKYITENQIKIQSMVNAFRQQQAQGTASDVLQKLANEIDQTQLTFENELKRRGEASKDPILALYYVSFLSPEKYPDDNKKIVERLKKEAPASSYTPEMAALYASNLQKIQQAELAKKSESATAIGAVAPDLAYTSPDGKTLKLSDLRGKVVLLDFWASWCRPCRMENPNVVASYKRFKDKGFEIYSVSLDQNGEAWKSAIQADGLIWTNHVSDLKGWQSEPAHIYGVQGIPAQFLLDKDGKIVAKNLRGEQLEQKLSEMLK